MRKINLFIHPGYPKSGTTFLQEEVFSKIYFMNLAKPFNNEDLKTSHYEIFKPKYAENINLSSDKRRRAFELYIKHICDLIDNSEVDEFILSDEIIYDEINYNTENNFKYLKNVLNILKEKYLINLKFIVSIRNQSELLPSFFAYDYHRQKVLFSTLDEFVYNIIKDKKLTNYFYYSELVEKIKTIFNCEILILPIEQLSIEPNKYYNNLTSFLGISEKINFINNYVNQNHVTDEGKKKWKIYTRSSYFFYPLAFIHKILKKVSMYEKLSRNFAVFLKKNLVRRKFAGYIETNDNLEKLVKNHFQNSNKNLEKMYNLDLKKLSYY